MGNTSGMSITSLVFGILSLVLGWFPLIGWVFIILAITFGIISLVKINKDSNLTGKGFAIAGIVMGCLALAYVLLQVIGMLAYFGVLSPDNMLPERTTFAAPIPNLDNALLRSDGSIEVPLMNDVGGSIEVLTTNSKIEITSTNDPKISCSSQNIEIDGQQSNKTVANTNRFNIKWLCNANIPQGEKISATLSFDYKNLATGETKTQTGQVSMIKVSS